LSKYFSFLLKENVKEINKVKAADPEFHRPCRPADIFSEKNNKGAGVNCLACEHMRGRLRIILLSDGPAGELS
jgi:hypothetical protein